MKVIVAHPSKQHSFYTATGLKKGGMLFKYITTVYDRPGSWTRRLKGFLGGVNEKRANGRKCEHLNDNEIVQFCELSWLFSLILSKIPRAAKFRELHRRFVCKRFGIKVAKYSIKYSVDAVIMYDSTAESCFKYLKEHAPHIKRILDVSIADRDYLRKIFESDLQDEYRIEFQEEQWIVWDTKMVESLHRENSLADCFLVPSEFVKKSLIQCGVQERQCWIVPYGVDVERFTQKTEFTNDKTLRIVYVGYSSYRKGIHHLLKVVSQFSADDVMLEICGDYNPSSTYYTKYHTCDNVSFCGFITRDVLAEKYQKADAFVIATLGEGLAQVGEEALACGLPVICTDCSGINDWIVDMENGFVVKAGDEESLRNCFEWCIKNKNALHKMSQRARETAELLSMDCYYTKVAKAVSEMLEDVR